ncbi:MAG: methionine adenosyltransferase [Patescibacteria group bacterium]|mgnify:CR=1 FL=1
MTNINYYYSHNHTAALNPDNSPFEVVERKFRGHPDSLADMIAQSFAQKYIFEAWNIFPALERRYFPNFSADKVTLAGASSSIENDKIIIKSPVSALLIGKITQNIGGINMGVDSLFKTAIEDVMSICLHTNDYKQYITRQIYSVNLAGVDRSSNFYNPTSISDLITILQKETFATSTVYVVAYAPLSITEKLSIFLDNFTNSPEFIQSFPAIGSDIKVLVRRKDSEFIISLCLPVRPEIINTISGYNSVIKSATKTIEFAIVEFLKINGSIYAHPKIHMYVNTKDTKTKKYFAVWGTALSKGDIGAVGRGNRQQGFISGIRPSTNEAISGKNPQHFSGVIYQIVAENIAFEVFKKTGLKNVVYITANNGDPLDKPNLIDVLLEPNNGNSKAVINKIIMYTLANLDALRTDYILTNPVERFMRPKCYFL